MSAGLSTVAAFPAKLPDGTWGARCDGAVKIGDVVTVTTRGGKSWTARIVAVGPVCRTESMDGRPAQRARPARRGYEGGYSRGKCEDAPCCGCCS